MDDNDAGRGLGARLLEADATHRGSGVTLLREPGDARRGRRRGPGGETADDVAVAAAAAAMAGLLSS